MHSPACFRGRSKPELKRFYRMMVRIYLILMAVCLILALCSQQCENKPEKICMLSVEHRSDTVYMTFSPDSMEIRLSQFHDSDSLVLTRHTLPSGDYVWNREDDDTPNVRRVNGQHPPNNG